MTPSTSINAPNHGIAVENFFGQIIMTKYQRPTRANAPDAIRSQIIDIGSYAIGFAPSPFKSLSCFRPTDENTDDRNSQPKAAKPKIILKIEVAFNDKSLSMDFLP